MSYDTSLIRIREFKHPATPGDSISPEEHGILSNRWGVQEGEQARYLSLGDLKKLGGPIGMETLQFWITGGFEVRSTSLFRKYHAELKRAGVIADNLPVGFQVSERKEVQGYRYLAATIYDGRRFVKFHYLVSKENDAMLFKREILVDQGPVDLVPNPGSPGQFFLKNPADSVSLKKNLLYRDITERHRDALLK